MAIVHLRFLNIRAFLFLPFGPGIAPDEPLQGPFHAGFQYFELDKGGDMWKQIQQAGALALHAGGNFPGIDFELWAIKT